MLSVDLEYLRGRIKEARRTVDELRRLTSKSFEDLGVDEKYSVRYQVVVIAEAVGSICLHVAIEGLGYEPESYSRCFVYLGGRGVIKCADGLVKIVRLRNLLVHRYWTIDDFRVYRSVKENFKCVEEFLRAVEEKYGVPR